MRKPAGYTLLEMLICVGVLGILFAVVATAGWKAYESSALGISTANIRQLSAGAQAYLTENDHHFWPFCEKRVGPDGGPGSGTRWWFGLEREPGRSEGDRDFDPSRGPLGAFVPKALRPDPSLALHGTTLKPKFRQGYLGVGYNAVLAGGWLATKRTSPMSYWELPHPGRVVVFATCAQVNTFQGGASAGNPKIEDFYGFDEREVTIHFRHGGAALVAYADGSGGFLPIDESTRDSRLPTANIGRFAPRGSFQYLK